MAGGEKRFLITRETKVSDYANLPEIRVILVGKTGNGKSATGNTILGWNFFISKTSAESVTSKGNMGKMRWKGKVYTVVDTPGILDTNMSEDSLRLEIVKSFGMLAPGPHIILFILSTSRYTIEDDNVKSKLDELLKGNPYSHMAVCFTGKDNLEFDSISENEFIKKRQSLNDLICRCNGNVIFLNNRLTDSDKLTEQWKCLYTFIDKILESNKGSYYTDAALQEIDAEMEKLESKQLPDCYEQAVTKAEKRAQLQWDISINGYILDLLLAAVMIGICIGLFTAIVLFVAIC